MTDHSIYQAEKEIIKRANELLQDEKHTDQIPPAEYAKLAESYDKLFKKFKRIVKINDKQQHQIFEAQRSILVKNDELNELNATKDKFFSIISHDLKSPINSFLNVASLLMDHIDRFSKEEIQEMAGSVKVSGNTLLKLLENLLHWARLQMNHVDFTPEKCDLQELFDHVMSMTQYQAQEKNITVVTDFENSTDLFADPNMIASVMQNLISNAIKFTATGGTITVRQKSSSDFSEISVQDTGVGMSDRNLKKLFRIDIIYSGIGTNAERGTGLGLILCKEMVERHKGKIWVDSEKDMGTTFTFTCPANENVFNQD